MTLERHGRKLAHAVEIQVIHEPEISYHGLDTGLAETRPQPLMLRKLRGERLPACRARQTVGREIDADDDEDGQRREPAAGRRRAGQGARVATAIHR
jgi:hypothetical protein